MSEDDTREEKIAHGMDPLNIINRFITADHWSQQEQYLEMRYALRLLDSATAQTLLSYALDLHDRHVEPDSEPGLTILQWLMQVRPEVCTGLPAQMLKRQIFGAGILYYGADAATRTTLISIAEAALTTLMHKFSDLIAHTRWWNDETLQRTLKRQLGQMTEKTEGQFLDQILRALSWIGDEPVQQWFHRMRTQMTFWETLFYLSVDDYVSEGGWELTPEGERRDLYFPHAYQLIAPNMVSDSNQGAVAVSIPFEERCHWCGLPLTVLLDLDLSHPALSFLPIDGCRLRLIMCEGCFLENQLFMEVDFEGNARWSSFNALTTDQKWQPEETNMFFTPPDRRLVLGPPCTSPFEVVARADEWDISQLGGMPSWVQDAGYVLCPSCRRRMIFVGQIVPCAITNRAIDGVFYSLLCLTCHLSTITYQCT